MNKDDRRSKKTEKALLRALSELLEQKQLREITVNELVQRADLHRSTFYTHHMTILMYIAASLIMWMTIDLPPVCFSEQMRKHPSDRGLFSS